MGGISMFTLIKNINILAPEPIGKNDILLCNDKIVRIAKDIDFAFEGLNIIDGTGKTAMPGLIDQHVHLIGGGGEDGFASLTKEVAMTDCVKSGVTTVVGVLGTDSQAKSVEALVAKTKALNEQGITAYCLTGSYMYPSNTLTSSVRKDISFISEIIGVKIALSDHRSSNITTDELARLATQARYGGLLAKKAGEVHIHLGIGKVGLQPVIDIVEQTDIPITTFRPTHCANQLEDALRFAKMGGYIDFTCSKDTGTTATLLELILEKVPLAQVTLSSDANGSMPIWNEAKEIVGMGVGKMSTLYDTVITLHLENKVDLSSAVALVTRNVAQALNLYPTKGTLQENSAGDILIVDENLKIDTVIARGQVMMDCKKMVASNYYQDEA